MKDNDITKCVDLDSCIEWILNNSVDSQVKEWSDLSEDDALSQAHHGFGTFLRNTLGLWHDGPPVKYFNNLGIYHADDMSGIILTSLHRKLNDKDFELDKQVKHYIDYWEEHNPEVNKGKIE